MVGYGSRSYGDGGKGLAPLSLCETDGGAPMTQVDDLSRSLITFEQNSTMVVVLEMSQSSWLAAGVVPGIERRPLKKLDPDPMALLRLVAGWRDHAMSVAVSREHRRAKTDRLGTEMLIRVFLGWLRGEPRHCKMVAIPTLEEEDARRPSRERESLIGERTRIINRMKAALIRLGIRGFKPELLKAPQRLEAQHTAEGVPIPPNMLDELRRDMARLAWVREQINAIEQARLERLEQAPSSGPHAMVRTLASIIGVGVETADMLVQEILSRNLRDRRAVARYAGLTGSPDESGVKRREKGLAKAGNARVRRGLIQLAWRFLRFQKESALGQWYRARTEGAAGKRKTTMIVALARKLLIALWRMVTTGEIPAGVALRTAAA